MSHCPSCQGSQSPPPVIEVYLLYDQNTGRRLMYPVVQQTSTSQHRQEHIQQMTRYMTNSQIIFASHVSYFHQQNKRGVPDSLQEKAQEDTEWIYMFFKQQNYVH